MPITAAPNAGLSQSLHTRFQRLQGKTSQALERLATGKRINRPSDDPAGFIAAEQIRGELTDLTAELKTYDLRRLSLRQQGSTLATIQSELIDLKGRIVEATGDQIGQDEKAALQQQVEAALETFAYLESGYDRNAVADLGAGGPANLVDGDTAEAAAIVEGKASAVATRQAEVGIGLRELDRSEQLAQDKQVILAETLSQIEDADFAEETANLAVSQTLTQAATAAMAYSQRTHADTVGQLLDEVDVAEPDAK